MKKLTPLQKRVEAGVAYLNVVSPNWEKKIDLDKLDLRMKKTCIIGQLEGHYDVGIEKMGLDGHDRKISNLGFNSLSSPRDYFLALTSAWKNKIKELRKKK